MEVLGLVGGSGTGKSHRALQVAISNDIEVIIDDGLLIKGSRIVAGSSAKRQQTKVGAIKTALFVDNEHAQEVIESLANLKPEKILVLGTSVRMVNQIAKRLNIDFPASIIHIEEVSTQGEIAKALYSRKNFGRHVIPAPSVEVKPKLSGTIIEPLKTFFKRNPSYPNFQPDLWIEQSVVRPTFNYLGKFYIANNVLNQIIIFSSKEIIGLAKIMKIDIETNNQGIIVDAEISIQLQRPCREIARELQHKAISAIDLMTSIHVINFNVLIKTVDHS